FDSWLNKAIDMQRVINNNEILNVILIIHPPSKNAEFRRLYFITGGCVNERCAGGGEFDGEVRCLIFRSS
ncbi:MAG TPA: hypothetical protein VFJ67_01455, partial [Thermodesulfobacteriota bacterium]|nr:hypothetical protein [Thermodesulfobacteriota bacterium]